MFLDNKSRSVRCILLQFFQGFLHMRSLRLNWQLLTFILVLVLTFCWLNISVKQGILVDLRKLFFICSESLTPFSCWPRKCVGVPRIHSIYRPSSPSRIGAFIAQQECEFYHHESFMSERFVCDKITSISWRLTAETVGHNATSPMSLHFKCFKRKFKSVAIQEMFFSPHTSSWMLLQSSVHLNKATRRWFILGSTKPDLT